MSFHVVLGAFMIAYGVVNLCLRTFAKRPSLKLELMQRKWGERRGLVIHVVSYVVFPAVLGAILVLRGLTAAPPG